MVTNLTTNGGSSFKIRRPIITTSGFVSDIDGTVKDQLDKVEKLLKKKIFKVTAYSDPEEPDTIDSSSEKTTKTLGKEEKSAESFAKEGIAAAAARRARERVRAVPDPRKLLAAPLTPKRVPGDTWASGSLLYQLKAAQEAEENISLSDFIDMTADLSALKYGLQSALAESWFTLDANTKAVLEDYPSVTDYLLASAYYLVGLKDVTAIKNFVINNPAGSKKIVNYAIVSAARTIIEEDGLAVDKFNEDTSPFVEKVKAAGLPLSSLAFRPALKKKINEFVFDSDEAKMLEDAGLGDLPAEIKPQLIRYMQNSPVKITPANINYFLPTFISQAWGSPQVADITPTEPEEADRDFEVEFPEEDVSQVQINRTAVKCAAQLYYGMVIGEELEVFNTMNYYTHHYMLRTKVKTDDRLRDTVGMYVFDEKFTYLTRNNERVVASNTKPAERQMFYRQCFDEGAAQLEPMMSGREYEKAMVANKEFKRLWKVLIFESAKYLQRARESFNPHSFVSRQNVMQAVEDLQYNLSNNCTGMVTVIAPRIYKELKFITDKILNRDDVVLQVSPSGGSWLTVVEKYHEFRYGRIPNTTALFNKAKLGYQIIRSIADYNPATFDDDKNFSAFISLVDAFITTQSILQEDLADDLVKGDQQDEGKYNVGEESAPGLPPGLPEPAPPPTDDWDF